MDTIPGTTSHHILILEDDTDHQQLALTGFKKYPEQFRVSLAGTVLDAREIIDRDPPDLIIADWKLPDGNGLDILPLNDGIVTTPLIIMTSHGDEQLAVEIIKSGAIDYVVKSATVFENLPHITRRAFREWDNIRRRKEAEEAFKTAREWLGIALRSAHAGTWDWDFPTGRLTWSPEFFELFGLSSDKTPSFEVWLDVLHPDDREPTQATIKRSIENHTPLWNEYRVILPDGEVRWIGAAGSTTYTDAGEPVRMSGICIDINSRKLAEEKFRESENRFRVAQELSPDGFTILHPVRDNNGEVVDFTWIYENQTIARLNATDPQNVIGKRLLDMFPAHKGTPIFEAYIQAADTGTPQIIEDTYVGEILSRPTWLRLVIVPMDKDIAILAQDITERKAAEQIRKQYTARLNSAMEIGILAWWEMDLPDGAVRFDDRKATLLGYSPDKFRHYADFTALLHPDDLEPAMQAMQDHFDGKKPRYQIDYRIKTASKDYLWFRDVGGITQRHNDGSPATVTGICIDITTSKKAEETLRATETRFRALIQNSSDIIRILDRDGRIVFESPSSGRILGYQNGELIGKDPMDYIHPYDLEHVKRDLEEVINKTNPGTPTEFRIRKADGEYLWVDAIGTNLLDVPGINGIVVTTRTIQKRKEAEQALRENQARLATAMDIAHLVNWEYDVASSMFTFDDRFYTLYGTKADHEGGNLMSAKTYTQEFVYPEDRPKVFAEIQKLLATKDPTYTGQMEHRITPRDGSIRTIIARCAPIMGPDGTVVRTFGANQDITDFKIMESEIRSLNTVLEQRVKDRTEALVETNKMLKEENTQRLEGEKKLQMAYEEKVMLLKEVHHRVKNNLQIIASLLNLQSRYIKDEPTLAAIKESQNRVKAMALVHEKLYRSENITHISLNDYIRFLGTGLFQFYDAKSRGIQFTLEIHDVNVDINAAIPIGLIINELISNSLKYAFPEGRRGEICISIKREGHTLDFLYRDTGIGIPADLNWRESSSLGLRLVTSLVDQMDGTVELDRNAGTQFTMVLHEKGYELSD